MKELLRLAFQPGGFTYFELRRRTLGATTARDLIIAIAINQSTEPCVTMQALFCFFWRASPST
jgi:hypothetical protein